MTHLSIMPHESTGSHFRIYRNNYALPGKFPDFIQDELARLKDLAE
jgi:hypothetical protein